MVRVTLWWVSIGWLAATVPVAAQSVARGDTAGRDLPRAVNRGPSRLEGRDRAWLGQHLWRPWPDPLARARTHTGRSRSGEWPLEPNLALMFDCSARWVPEADRQLVRLTLIHRLLVDRWGPQPLVFAPGRTSNPGSNGGSSSASLPDSFSELVSEFNVTWGVADDAYRDEHAAELGRRIDQLERQSSAKFEVATRRSVQALYSRRVGEWRERYLGTLAEAQSSGLRHQGQLRDEYYETLTRLSRIVHSRTRSLYSTAFDAIEKPYLEAWIDTPPDRDTSELDRIRQQSESSIAELQGRALVEVMTQVTAPSESLAGKRQQAEADVRRQIEAAVTRLEELDRKGQAALAAERDQATQRIDKILGELDSFEPSALRPRLWSEFETIVIASRKTVGQFERDAQRIVRRVKSDLSSSQQSAVLDFRAEAQAFRDAIAPRTERVNLEVREIGYEAQREFAKIAKKISLYGESPPSEDRPPTGRRLFETLPDAALGRGLGYPLAKNARLSFSERWLREREEMLNLQFQGVVQLFRISSPDLSATDLRSLASEFNLLWSRQSLDEVQIQDFSRKLVSYLNRIAPRAELVARVELFNSRHRVWSRWRSSQSERSTEFRVLAAQLSNQFRTGIPEGTLTAVRAANQRAADSLAANLTLLGQIESSYFDERALLDNDDQRSRLELEKGEALRQLADALAEGLAAFQSKGQDELTRIGEASKKKTAEIRAALERALADLERRETRFENNLNVISDAASEDLDRFLGPFDGRPSLFRYGERFGRVGRHLREVDQKFFSLSEKYRKELNEESAELRVAIIASAEVSEVAPELRPQSLEVVEQRLAIRCRGIVESARRSFRRIRGR